MIDIINTMLDSPGFWIGLFGLSLALGLWWKILLEGGDTPKKKK